MAVDRSNVLGRPRPRFIKLACFVSAIEIPHQIAGLAGQQDNANCSAVHQSCAGLLFGFKIRAMQARRCAFHGMGRGTLSMPQK